MSLCSNHCLVWSIDKPNAANDSRGEDAENIQSTHLRQRTRESLESIIETMHLSLFGLPSSKQSSATPDARFTKPQSHFQRTMADRATKRQQRRQQLKESLENNSQAVNKSRCHRVERYDHCRRTPHSSPRPCTSSTGPSTTPPQALVPSP